MLAIISPVIIHAGLRTLITNGAAVRQHMKKKDLKRESEAGEKQRAGRLLSTFLRTIAQEKIKIVGGDEVPKTVTKARALANQIWARALGTYSYVDIKTGEVKTPAPDKQMIELIFERCEGRVGTHEEEVKKDASVPGKISDARKQHLNQCSLEAMNEK